MSPLKDILTGVAQRYRWQRAEALMQITLIWDGALGRPLCENVKPVGFVDGTLIVAVPSPVWTQELMYLRATLIEQINLHLRESEIRVQSLKMVVRGMRRVPNDLNAQAVLKLGRLANTIRNED